MYFWTISRIGASSGAAGVATDRDAYTPASEISAIQNPKSERIEASKTFQV